MPETPFNLHDPAVVMALVIIALTPLCLYVLIRWMMTRPKKVLKIILDKDRLYLPKVLHLTITNIGKQPVDIGNPIMVFRHYFFRRKLKLKGTEGYHFYPLYLDAGKSHELSVDMNSFFLYDPGLKKYSSVTVHVTDLTGKFSASKSIKIRKSLFS
jgi:hypothetical protein